MNEFKLISYQVEIVIRDKVFFKVVEKIENRMYAQIYRQTFNKMNLQLNFKNQIWDGVNNKLWVELYGGI